MFIISQVKAGIELKELPGHFRNRGEESNII